MRKVLMNIVTAVSVPRLIIIAFFIFLCVMAVILRLSISELLSSSLVRIGMNGILVLAILPSITCGTGPNFALSLGICCGLVGGLTAMEFELDAYTNFFAAIAFSIPLAILVGLGHGLVLNKVKGSEMMFNIFIGWSAVSIMKVFWLVAPFRNPEMAWPIGRGVRVTIALLNRQVAQLLNNTFSFQIGDITIPTGLWLFFILCCFLVWLFMRTKTGIAMQAAGDNPRFAEAAGINVDRQRIIGTVLSAILGAVGILVYAQSFGFYQLYEGPHFMPIIAVAAILIGGASIKKASILNVIVGVILFQGILVISMPVFNIFTQDMASMGEIARVVITNGIILYALTQIVSGGD
jgi:simple sugar transport system permease protein